MARSKNTWRGRVTGVGLDVESGSVVLEIMAVHGNVSHPVRVELEISETDRLDGQLMQAAALACELEKAPTNERSAA